MDYARFNYVAQPGDGVRVTTPAIGPYDLMAIEWGYRWFPNERQAEQQHLRLFYRNIKAKSIVIARHKTNAQPSILVL